MFGPVRKLEVYIGKLIRRFLIQILVDKVRYTFFVAKRNPLDLIKIHHTNLSK